ncbi:dTDP-4-dehydrorhamnose 3,5-epimerase family protein [Maritimibacter sp. UBA3975]|uniref:dTDP-4-dehydrorhamnose 3,5-epimerase family protein n=1 Tax=Maritimibacter sp. UBA3975 TaxID=1946833 RepID=UPI0025B92AAB|nr:dTDP-4-dehydrorhamnose 3,5-epimerase family protein [Maritimibacter sp. UBA3975]|tara:strand:- start:6745 stop:7323 length:579 start_codon:yes stop_codon:yes gene_type:complete
MDETTRLDALPRTGMTVEPCGIAGLWRVACEPVSDERGFFLETFRRSLVDPALGRPYQFVQGNHSRSAAGTLRGFRSEPWDKLIYVARGTALIVVVDPRPDSPTFRQHEKVMLGDAPGRRDRLLISQGLANAFYCVTEVDYINDVSQEYEPSVRRGFRWNDPTLGIDWPNRTPILSPADQSLPDFDAYQRGV